MNTNLLNLNLNDIPTNTHLQYEAAAMPDHASTNPANIRNPADQNSILNDPTNNQKPNNRNTGTVRGTNRPLKNSHLDHDIRTPTFHSNCARHMRNLRDSGRWNFKTQYFNRRRSQNHQNQIHNNMNNAYNANNIYYQLNQSINNILRMAVLIPTFDGTENTFENFEISCQDAARILSVNI